MSAGVFAIKRMLNNMKTDSYFSIGSTHKVCQDYTIHEADHVILSDGCSSVPNSDVGARIISHLTSQRFKRGLKHVSVGVEEAVWTSNAMGLNPMCLCATLLTINTTGCNIEATMVGDGCIVSRRRNNKELEIFNLEFVSGAPVYPYYFSDGMIDQYLSEFGDKYKVNGIVQPNGYFTDYKDWILRKPFPINEYDMVAVFSDGVNSFQETVKTDTSITTIPFSAEKVISEILDIKGFAGNFIQRRCNRVLKDLRGREIQHTDDFSVGVININD